MDMNTDVDGLRFPNIRKYEAATQARSYLIPFAEWLVDQDDIDAELMEHGGQALIMRYLGINERALVKEKTELAKEHGRRQGYLE